MSFATFYVGIGLAVLIAGLVIIYIVRGRSRIRKNKDGFQWQPEQDYDVVQRGETSMTPPHPVLVKREKKAPKQ